jgi:hypothetical protein
MSSTDIVYQVHRQAVRAPLTEIAGLLQDVLGQRLTAFIAGVKEGKTVARWAKGEVTEIRDYQVEQRLRTAYEIAIYLLEYDDKETIRAWFIGMSPYLDDHAPIMALVDGRFREVLDAAKGFAANG